MTLAWWIEDVCTTIERAKCKAVIAICGALQKLDEPVQRILNAPLVAPSNPPDDEEA